MTKDLAFWAAVALVSVAASVLVKILATHTPWTSLHEFAAAS